MSRLTRIAGILSCCALPLLAGCEYLGIPDPAKQAAAKEADGKAIGSACRHALRAIEDCYALNPKAQKSAVYTGWREMDEYMRENKLEGIEPKIAGKPASAPASAPAPADEEDADTHGKANHGGKADKPAAKGGHH
ncbi:hypothetical protein ACG0Z6_10690 [Roseateles sp. BYS180W]|uniref:Lipoprotein n=1 Tax=Roseateles rivi TaxID=3299028 RepID=A0ABW7FWJ0_9BURK